MALPNADRAFVDSAKVRDYLLSNAHPVGRFKAAFFISLGYSQAAWEKLRDDLLLIAMTGEAVPIETTPFGRKFQVGGKLTGPSGRSVEIVSIWIVLAEGQAPRFVTAYPK